MPRRLLPSHIGPYRVEHVTAVLFFALAGVPLLAPLLISYPTSAICQSVDGCQRLDGGRFKWEPVEQGNAFRRVLTLTVARGADKATVANMVVEQADSSLPWYWKKFPVRQPRVVVVQEQEVKSRVGKIKKGGEK